MANEPMVVALDVDGTLFDGRTVDPRAVAVVRAARDAGHVMLIVTGRPWIDLKSIIPDVLLVCSAAVCEHGALLVEIDSEAVRPLAPPVADWVREAITAAAPESVVPFESTLGLPTTLREIADEVCGRPGSGCYVVANKDSIAVVPDGCDKGTGLMRAIQQLDLDGRRVIAIGDATNDLPMFARADIAVAVANAEPALIETGIDVTESPFGGGVAEALTRHLALADVS
jgi:hydroxymethylpyrimidine pyrophosphatase-like HAD family hydrolase